jgi:hypothetical protein
MTQRGRSNAGRFQSQTATRTIVDEQIKATVQELEDGSKILTSVAATTAVAPEAQADLTTYDEQPDGSIIIRAAQDPSATEARSLNEPIIFTNPTQPNVTLAGTLYKTGPGEWRRYPVNRKHYIRFINGHAAARTDQQARKIRDHFPTVKGNKRVWEEPAPLLSEEQARERGLEPPFLFQDAQGKVLFWTYHRDALQAFTRTYMAHNG